MYNTHLHNKCSCIYLKTTVHIIFNSLLKKYSLIKSASPPLPKSFLYYQEIKTTCISMDEVLKYF